MSKPLSDHSGKHPLKYATKYHAPVLYKDVVEGLVSNPEGVYVDGTVGGGGHSAALLDALAPTGRLIGIDRDADALKAVSERLADPIDSGRLILLRGNFATMDRLLKRNEALPEEGVDGVLLDLGVSSHQIDAIERGFSYRGEGALDMRMDQREGVTADEVVNRWKQENLRRLLYDYGEERRGRRIAQAIVDARPLATTTELAAVIRKAVPERKEVKTLSRVFQGLRIAVNAELDALEEALHAGTRIVREGGRMAVISYHSLEDRRVKRFFRYGNFENKPMRDFYGNLLAPWSECERKPIEAGADEVEANPRARSARLRIAERLANENIASTYLYN